ncbi:hypothetical protein [Brevundimonas sp. NIBR11]|uniref:hypothetical protein n=1 Tax=Brevundimonas sp. NIBR11 TaxID=3015999 RepID=UPI0022F06C0F|nr:hypothetical protein [Brevundimonas sp. NIBR11]
MRRSEAAAIFNARAAFHCLVLIQEAFVDGNEVGAREALAHLAKIVAPSIPLLDELLAQDQAAQALHLQKRPMRVICAIGMPQPHPDAANPHVSPPEQPNPSVA